MLNISSVKSFFSKESRNFKEFLEQQVSDALSFFAIKAIRIWQYIPDKPRVKELSKAHLFGILVGLQSFYMSPSVLKGMGAGLITAVCFAVFSPAISPVMLYLSFAKTALYTGTVFGLISTTWHGLSNYFKGYWLTNSAKTNIGDYQIATSSLKMGQFPLVTQSVSPQDYAARLIQESRLQGPLSRAIDCGMNAANGIVSSTAKPVHTIYVPGKGVSINNAVDCLKNLIDGDVEVVEVVLKGKP